jgi:hypothetical protein
MAACTRNANVDGLSVDSLGGLDRCSGMWLRLISCNNDMPEQEDRASPGPARALPGYCLRRPPRCTRSHYHEVGRRGRTPAELGSRARQLRVLDPILVIPSQT